MLRSNVAKKRVIGLLLMAVILTLFFVFNRFPKLDIVQADLTAVSAPVVECFQGFCIDVDPKESFLRRWLDFSVEYLKLVTFGMTFAFLAAGITEAFFFPPGSGVSIGGTRLGRTLKGAAVGSFVNLCSACIVPVANSMRKRGAGIEGTVAVVQSSSTMNVPAMVMAALVFTPLLGGSRIILSVLGALLLGPIVAWIAGERSKTGFKSPIKIDDESLMEQGWCEVLIEGIRDWSRATLGYLVRLGPIMVVAGFASGLAIQWISPDHIDRFLGNNILGILVATSLGLVLNVPLLFEIPLVALLLIMGMGTGPAAALLFTAAAGGPVTFWGLSKVMSRRAVVSFAAATWIVGLAGGGIVWAITAAGGTDAGLQVAEATADESNISAEIALESRGELDIESGSRNSGLDEGMVRGDPVRFAPRGPSDLTWRPSDEPVSPFRNIARDALDDGYKVWNDRPGVAVFDYDRDGDLDFYLTQKSGKSNFLYRNDGTAKFTNVSEEALVQLIDSHSTGVVACDVNNDGYQDLYVGAWPDPDLDLDVRTLSTHTASTDHLLLNNADGTFTDVTDEAFGEAANYRAATSVSCADVDNDGWLDIFVGNLMAQAFRDFSSANHPGHYSVLYRNNGDGTFAEIAKEAGVRGSEVVMRAPDGNSYIFTDPGTGEGYEAWDPTLLDAEGNVVGEPTGQNHSSMFFDYDDDGDPDLFVANDGDRFRLYRNDSTSQGVVFTEVATAMGIDQVGAWMGFAIGDIDGDADLDVFATNMGYHPSLRPPMRGPSGSCEYHMRFVWGTCLHYLLRNDGVRDAPGLGTVGVFVNAASVTDVVPSPYMPPESLDHTLIHELQQTPTGLAAYDFGFGATFFDFDNDGCQDLYWLGSNISSGAGPGGDVFPGAGRLLRGDCAGGFTDVTVEAQVLDIVGVNYKGLDNELLARRPQSLKISNRFHENGKGVAHGDLNGDGYVDLIGTNSSGPVWEGRESTIEQMPGPTFVWLNAGGNNNWITLKLVGRQAIDGTGSNADGIGARVYLTIVSESGDTLTLVQEVRTGSSYISMDSVELEFGLGDAEVVENIFIFWPSRMQQTLTDVEVNQVLEIVEAR